MYFLEPFKTQLVTALRSGQYTQGYYQLCDTSGDETRWCCLGVAADISELGSFDKTGSYCYQLPSGHLWTESEQLPVPVLSQHVVDEGKARVENSDEDANFWLDQDQLDALRKMFPTIMIHETSLAELNDSRLFTFAQIADFIEEHC